MPGILNANSNASLGLDALSNGSGSIPLISFRDSFLDNLSIWHNAIPLRTQWIVIFDGFPQGLRSSILRDLEIVTGSKDNFNIDQARTALLANENQKIIGCVYAQGVNIPSENLTVSPAAIENNRGYIQGSVIGSRDAYANQNLTIEFRETNTSFTDFILRPWLILASHFGYVARSEAEQAKNPKCNIIVMQFGKTLEHISSIPRKIWTFYDCVPLNLDTRNLTYDTEVMESYHVPFLYSRYDLSSNLTSLPDTLTNLNR